MNYKCWNQLESNDNEPSMRFHYRQNDHETPLFGIGTAYSNVSGRRTEKKRCHALKLMRVEIGNPISENLIEPLKSNAEFDETPIRGKLFAIDSFDVSGKSL